ncbi:MAG: glycosyltransferase [Crocinitomicaceae bacterium]|nr:glycosyltransferase [Crocinitomicaceae bacterium]
MIKVLRIINRFNLGGPTYNATYLTAFLSDDFETKLIGGKHEEHEGASVFIPEKYGVEFELVQEMQREISFSQDRKALRRIREIIREYQPDIVHTHASKAGFLGRYAAYKENVPVIVHTFHGHVFHSYFNKLKTTLYKNLERFVAKRSDAIIAISEIQKDELCSIHKIAPEDKFRVIPLGFDLDRFQENHEVKRQKFREDYDLSPETLVIGIIGRLTAIKNHELLFDAVKLIVGKTTQPFKVIVIGDGELMTDLKNKARLIENQLNEEIFVFTSWIKDIDKALPGLDMVCLSSLNEGTPVSLIEAQAAAVPVITTNVGGVKNVVDHGNTGLVVDSFDPVAYGEAMLSLLNSQEIRRKMSQNGWIHVKDKFHYLRLCKDVENLYKELLKKKGVKK